MKKVLEALTEMQVKMPIETVFLVLLVAFLVSLIIFITYKHTYTGVLYNPRFNVSLIMITMITTIVMVVIGSNISVSLGMVGALSIIRFRTAVKDPRDTAFIFWGVDTKRTRMPYISAMAAGLAVPHLVTRCFIRTGILKAIISPTSRFPLSIS